CTVVACHHADSLLSVVAAASVVAKVHRDRAIRSLAEEHGSIGSGYPSDPATRRFLDECIADGGPLPPSVRTTWRTVADRLHARAGARPPGPRRPPRPGPARRGPGAAGRAAAVASARWPGGGAGARRGGADRRRRAGGPLGGGAGGRRGGGAAGGVRADDGG